MLATARGGHLLLELIDHAAVNVAARPPDLGIEVLPTAHEGLEELLPLLGQDVAAQPGFLVDHGGEHLVCGVARGERAVGRTALDLRDAPHRARNAQDRDAKEQAQPDAAGRASGFVQWVSP